jgi:hypothetical protein
LTFRDRCVETAGDKSVKCVQSRENSLSVVNPSLNLCNESQANCVQFVSDKCIPLDELKFPSHMRVVCEHSIDARECRVCDVSKRVLLSDEIVNVSSQNYVLHYLSVMRKLILMFLDAYVMISVHRLLNHVVILSFLKYIEK